jgi:hypothetical protein
LNLNSFGMSVRSLNLNRPTSMTISVTCACGKEYRLGDDKAGRRFDCRECRTEVRVPQPEMEATRIPDLIGAEEVEETSPVRFVPASKRRSKRRRSDSEDDDREPSPRSRWLPSKTVLLGASLIVGALLIVVGVCWSTQSLPQLRMIAVIGLVILASIGGPFLIDYYNRQRIREEIEGYGGTINRIQWKPFQGMFFSTGWTRQRQGRFYDVTYTDRDGQRRSGLCAVSPWGGTRWDDDIDNSLGWGGPGDSQLLPVIAGSALLLVMAVWLVGVEAVYSIYGETTSGTVTKVHRYETTYRSSRRGSTTWRHETRLTVHYTYKSKNGTQQVGTADNTINGFYLIDPRDGGSVNVQYIPGNGFWSRLVKFNHATFSPMFYLGLLAAIVVIPFALLQLLDYFDVFKLHGDREK